MNINGDLCHDLLAQNLKQKLSFNPNCDFPKYKKELKEKFIELLGLDNIKLNAVKDCNFTIENDEIKDDCRIIRFTFESEIGAIVPCYLVVPNTKKEKYPVAITLQGHSTGFHNSIGIVKYPERDINYQPRGAFALQAAKNGFIGLAIEQRGMGERKSDRGGNLCEHTALTSFLLGRTILGERVWDVSRAIDTLANFPMCDLDNIIITGNSGGGTISYYSAVYDDRIKLSAPSCSFCPYKESILSGYHCSCNFIPNAYNYFDMQDLACLIAPRKLLVITGEKDMIFPVGAVKRGFETVKAVYEKEGKSDNCKLVTTSEGHWWCMDLVWHEINGML